METTAIPETPVRFPGRKRQATDDSHESRRTRHFRPSSSSISRHYMSNINATGLRKVCDAMTHTYPWIFDFYRPMKPPFKTLVEQPYRRPITENPNRSINVSSHLSGSYKNHNFLALCVQAAGLILPPEQQCSRCAAGQGIWSGCVVDSNLPDGLAGLLGGACSCCYFNKQGNGCSLKSPASTPVDSASTFAYPTSASTYPTSTATNYPLTPPGATNNPPILSQFSIPSQLSTPSSYIAYPVDQELVAHYMLMSRSKLSNARKRRETALEVAQEDLEALRIARKKVNNDDATQTTPPDGMTLLVGHYRSLLKTKRDEIGENLKGSIGQSESHLAAMRTAESQIESFNSA